MSSCCACCCFYPKYKRKVDNIYPRSLDAPLNKPEVDKLQYYVKIHPEKLSKIGDYLYQNLKWGLNGTYKNKNYVKNTIEAVDKILMAITPQNLNYYANSYLRIIQKLLEQGGAGAGLSNNGIATSGSGNLNVNYTNNDNLEYQKMAASMFQKFCDKEASNSSTTSFNSNYDSFVCQFSTMCYNNNKDERIKAEIRSSGLQCLATMVKRLVPDDSLRAGYLWDNMDKIVPALLFIMHENFTKTKHADPSEECDDRDLERYTFKSKFRDADDEISLTNSRNDSDIDRVRIKFRKNNTNNNNNDNLIGGGANSTSHLEKVNRSGNGAAAASGSSSPDEGNVMIVLSESNAHRIEVVDPDHESKMLLKNLAHKADFTTINKIVSPILTYLDGDKATGWQDARFVRCIFLILMSNVKQQHAIVIKELIKHLDSHRNSSAQLKCYIIRAISICIRISAMHSVGTAGQITEITTNLLKHLNISVEKAALCEQQQPHLGRNELSEQNKLQREIINAISEFTSHLPDYSKNEVIMFITRFINSQQFSYLDLAMPKSASSENPSSMLSSQLSARDQLNAKLRPKYFECLHEICAKYKPTQLFGAFTSGQFFEDILRLTLVSDWASRLRAHDILHQLLDKYQILNRIKQLKPNLFYDSIRAALVASSGAGGEMNTSTSSNSFYKSPKDNANSSSLSLNKVSSSSYASPKRSDSSRTNLKMTRNQTYLSQLGLNENKFAASREDVQFMRKYGRTFLAYLNENLFLVNNRRESFENVFLTTGLFLIGLFSEKEFLVDLVRFGFHVQELALLNFEQPAFSFALQCNIHKFVCAYFLLLSKTHGLGELFKYCSEICDARRKKDLFRYVYPEYILLDTMLPNDSGLSSASASLTEIENEFKRELSASAKEYANTIRNQKQSSSSGKDREKLNSSQANLDAERNNDNNNDTESNLTSSTLTNKLSASKKSLASASSTKIKDDESKPKTASWLFNKKLVGELLETAGYSTTLLFMPNSDYSLSVSYLQQTLNPIQTALRFRSPYSYSYDSIAAMVPGEDANSSEQPTTTTTSHLYHHHRDISKTHTRGYSGAGPIGMSPSNQLISTPRRSIEGESYSDDNTSYDSTSQISIDPNGCEGDYVNNKLFYIDGGLGNGGVDANQATINSLSVLRQQQNLYIQQSKDITSFETIKRILFNGNAIGSNLSNSGIGGGGSGTLGANSGIVLTNRTSSTSSMAHKNSLKQNGTSNENDQDSNQSDQQMENSMKIISEFQHKPFDEIKESLIKSNQQSKEKYQQVFEFVSKEITKEGSSIGGGLANSGGSTVASNLSQINNIGNMNSNVNSSLGSLSGSSNQSGATANGVYYKETYQQRMIPLNDIEFPQLFMY